MNQTYTSTAAPSRPSTAYASSATEYLRQEYLANERLFRSQPAVVHRALNLQARVLADAIVRNLPEVHFTLPEKILVEDREHMNAEPRSRRGLVWLPVASRHHTVGGLLERLTRTRVNVAIRHRLAELEQDPHPAVAVSAVLLRHATALHMVHVMLPTGRTVQYVAEAGEVIPTIPLTQSDQPGGSWPAGNDGATAISTVQPEEDGRADVDIQSPYVAAARRFYLPQWVFLDDQGTLLVNSPEEAEARLEAMQRFLAILHGAFALAPYVMADADYQQKRYGILGQLINQGRAYARFQTEGVIQGIQRRAQAGELNRGLRLSLPYFDDQALKMKAHEFQVVPVSRRAFAPGYVVACSREEQVKVAENTHLSPSTRKHLLAELKMLELAFVR